MPDYMTRITDKATGLSKRWNGTEWVDDTTITTMPPSGKYKVINLWVDPATGKLTVEYENTPVP